MSALQIEMFPEWHTRCVPDRSGAAQYVIMIRAAEDPKPPKKAAKHEDRDKTPHLSLRKQKPEFWEKAFARVLADGKPRTFNALCVLIAGITADIAGGELPEEVLWSMVEAGRVEFVTNAPIFFRLVGGAR